METRLLILNTDPVFEDRALSLFDHMDAVETRIVRGLSDAVSVLLGENFDAFVVEGEAALAVERAINARQHFPSLQVVCLVPPHKEPEPAVLAAQQNIKIIQANGNTRRLDRDLR